MQNVAKQNSKHSPAPIEQAFWALALGQAASRAGFCAPNPAVGAVLVKGGCVIAVGAHQGVGHPHAEVVALLSAGKKACGATLFVTLAPCCHTGKTPPCTDAIIASGVVRVCYAQNDPNPMVLGKSIDQLLLAGVECEFHVVPKIEQFYRAYCYWWRHKRPYVIAKLAVSLNGVYGAAQQGQRLQFTGAACEHFTHQKRQQADAILTTVQTIIVDNPLLNVRLLQQSFLKTIAVIDRKLDCPLQANILSTGARVLLFHQSEVGAKKRDQLTATGAVCVEVPVLSTEPGGDEHVNVETVLDYLGSIGIHTLWVEAGGRFFDALQKQKRLQEAYVYISPQTADTPARLWSTHPFSTLVNQKSRALQWSCCGDDLVAHLLY